MQAPNRGGSSDREKELERRVESLEKQLERALAEIERLRQQLEEALRANKRSAAPISKGSPKRTPSHRDVSRGRHTARERRDRFPAGWMSKSPCHSPHAAQHCQGPIILQNTQPQYQEDIVRVTLVRRFDVEVGTCACCGRHAQGRHPLQTSDALHVGRCRSGRKHCRWRRCGTKKWDCRTSGLARVLELGYGLTGSRSGICRALERLGNLAAPTYHQLKARCGKVHSMGWTTRVGV